MSKLKLVEPTQLAFSYEQLPESVALEARQAAERIRVRLRRTAEDIIMIGKDLLDTKERLPHGSFLPWIEAEFGMTDRTARRFMDVARVYNSKSDIVSGLDPSALYELAAPKTPIEVREEIEAMIAAGEVVKREAVIELRQRLTESQESVEKLAARNSELSAKKKSAPAVDVEAIKREAAEEAAAGYLEQIAALERRIALADSRAEPAKAEAEEGATSDNVVRPNFGADQEDIEDVIHPMEGPKAIGAFAGALASMEGLHFTPAAFWEHQGKSGTHGRRLHEALLEITPKLALLIQEYSK